MALFGLVGGLILIGAMLFVTLLAGLTYGRRVFAGLAIGLGVTWAVMFALSAAECARPGQPCGATPIDLAPHIALSLSLAALGVAAALVPTARIEEDDSRLGGK